jgi:membrane protease YdiL (CAAX protease family)
MAVSERLYRGPGKLAASLQGDDLMAARLRGFGPLGLLAIAVILSGNLLFVPLSAVLVIAWAWRSRTPWREIGYVRPASWVGDLMMGIAFGVALKITLKAIIMPLLGADPINQAYHYLAGNRAALPGALFAIILGAGWGEETLFRGYMFERLGKLLGTSAAATMLIVLLTSGLFGVAHYPDQGLAGAQQGAIVGLVFGTVFAVTGRLWMLMCAHAAFDLTALAIIYWGLEGDVARLIFGQAP